MLHRTIWMSVAGLLAIGALGGASPGDESPAFVIVDEAGTSHSIPAAKLPALPQMTLHETSDSHAGTGASTYSGPLLWSVLEQARVVDSAKPRSYAGVTFWVYGADGYAAAVAAGEIAPAFEGKPAIIATEADGKQLSDGHLRLIVPADRRFGRAVRDVERIVVQHAPR